MKRIPLKSFCTSVQAPFFGFVTLLCLSILPEMLILTESFGDRGNLLPNRCALLQGVQKTIESDDDWTILVRREHPLDDEWSVVATHGVSDDARVSASSILVFESVSGTDGLTVSHSLNDESSLESLEVHAAGSAGFGSGFNSRDYLLGVVSGMALLGVLVSVNHHRSGGTVSLRWFGETVSALLKTSTTSSAK